MSVIKITLDFIFQQIIISEYYTKRKKGGREKRNYIYISQLFRLAWPPRCFKPRSKPEPSSFSAEVKFFFCWYLFIYKLSSTEMLNSWEVCVSAYVVASKFPTRVLNLQDGVYILSFTDCFVVSQHFSVIRPARYFKPSKMIEHKSRTTNDRVMEIMLIQRITWDLQPFNQDYTSSLLFPFQVYSFLLAETFQFTFRSALPSAHFLYNLPCYPSSG